jgi:hypothetical protein
MEAPDVVLRTWSRQAKRLAGGAMVVTRRSRLSPKILGVQRVAPRMMTMHACRLAGGCSRRNASDQRFVGVAA